MRERFAPYLPYCRIARTSLCGKLTDIAPSALIIGNVFGDTADGIMLRPRHSDFEPPRLVYRLALTSQRSVELPVKTVKCECDDLTERLSDLSSRASLLVVFNTSANPITHLVTITAHRQVSIPNIKKAREEISGVRCVVLFLDPWRSGPCNGL